jgi:hypothetical protein
MSELQNKIKERLSFYIENDNLTNNDIVQLIEHLGSYLNLKTIPKYAKDNKIVYNTAKKYREKTVLFGIKFIIDNQ